MKTLRIVEIEPIFLDGFIPPDEELQDNKVYISREYKCAIHKCLCGCGNKSVTPLYGEGWNLIENEKGITLKPSILNSNCPNRSHYILTNNKANFV